MFETVQPPLTSWGNFYLITGSAGAALIGLQFVGMTLLVALGRRPTRDTLGAFGTPTVVHLASTLFISALMTTPWASLPALAWVLALGGAGGVGHIGAVVGRARRLLHYQMGRTDWLWYALVPTALYATLVMAAFFLSRWPAPALWLIGTATLGLLLLGIRNAWDTVTHLVVGGGTRSAQ